MSIVNVIFPSNLRFNEWPTETLHLCLYCSEKCPHVPFPKVKNYNLRTDTFYIQGFFCRPCCALGHIRETMFGGDHDKSYVWTQIFLKRYFGVQKFICAPPKTVLKKYGGTFTLEEFYGCEHQLFYKNTLEAPFLNNYMLHQFESGFNVLPNSHQEEAEEENELIRRPKIRDTPWAEHQKTGMPPLLLNFLATHENVPMEIQGIKKLKNSESLLKFMKKK
jgi:hypothetical protein